MVGGRVIRRLLGAGGDVRPMLDARDGQPSEREAWIAAYQDHEQLDATAGCEYVDDQIRLRE
jgi:hypothetical protein